MHITMWAHAASTKATLMQRSRRCRQLDGGVATSRVFVAISLQGEPSTPQPASEVSEVYSVLREARTLGYIYTCSAKCCIRYTVPYMLTGPDRTDRDNMVISRSYTHECDHRMSPMRMGPGGPFPLLSFTRENHNGPFKDEKERPQSQLFALATGVLTVPWALRNCQSANSQPIRRTARAPGAHALLSWDGWEFKY